MADSAAYPVTDDDETEPDEDEGDNNGDDEEDIAEDFDADDEEEEGEASLGSPDDLLLRLSRGPIRVWVHGVVVQGNSKTSSSLIEAEVLPVLRSAATLRGLVAAAAAAGERLRLLGLFDSVSITLDAGPPELPGTADVVIEVVEAKDAVAGGIAGAFSVPEARAWTLEGSFKLKNLFGYGDIWDASGAYGWDEISEISAGLSLPRFLALPIPLMARISMLSQDWFRHSSFKEHLLGLSFGLLSTKKHNLACNLLLSNPSRLSSESMRQLGHSLLPSIRYAYKIDKRDSHLRPTCGYAYLSTSQIGFFGSDSRSLPFLRQEFDLRGSIPLGSYSSALNIGVAAGVIMPWGRGFIDSPLVDKYYTGSGLSPMSPFGGAISLLGSKSRGLSIIDSRRPIEAKLDSDHSNGLQERGAPGGGLAVSAFADLSLDIPSKMFRDSGIYAHMFISAGNLAILTKNELQNFSFWKCAGTFRSIAGFGLVVPTKLFSLEVNYCYMLKQSGHDQAKTGIQFHFSSPR